MVRRPRTVLAILVSLAFVLVPQAVAQTAEMAPQPTDPAAPYRQLTLGPGRPLGAVTATLGRLGVELESGQAFPVLAATGEVVGVQLEGTGTWRVGVDQPEARRTYAAQANKISIRLNVGDGWIRDRFTKATLLFARPAFAPFLQGEATLAPTASAQDALRTTLELMDRNSFDFDHYALQARLGQDDVQYAWAEFEGFAIRAGYGFDTVRFGRETLYALEKSDYGRNFRFITWQPVPTIARSGFRLEHADVTVDTPDNRAGTIRSVLTLRVQKGQRVLPFGLVNERDPRSYGWKSGKNALKVRRVAEASGRELRWSHRYHELIVDLGAPLPEETVLKLSVDTDGEIFTSMNDRRGDNLIDLFQVDFFPMPQDAVARRFTFDLSIRTKKPFVPVASGDTVSLTEEEDHWVLKTRATQPIWLPAVYAGNFKTLTHEAGGKTIRIHSYAIASKRDQEQMAKMTATFLAIYEQMLGPYPFKEIDVVELPTYAMFGVSPSGVVLMTTRAFEDARLHKFLDTFGVNSMIAHELAHQWFGHKAFPRETEDAWLNESNAEYVAGLAMGIATGGKDVVKLQDFTDKLREWRSWSAMVQDTDSISGASVIAGDAGWDYRIFLLYNRGPLVLHQLRTLIGDERFTAILRRYLEKAEMRPQTTDDFAAAASAVLGTDMKWYFDQWIREPGLARIKVEHRIDTAGAQPTLVAKLTQDPARPFKVIHVPFVLEFADGHREVRLAFQEKPTQEFAFPLPAKPTKVTVDPGKNNLAVYE